MTHLVTTLLYIGRISRMKTTKELLTQVDKNGHIVDFIFCARYYLVLIMNDFEDEREIISRYCHQGDKLWRKVLCKINPKIEDCNSSSIP